MSMIDRQDDERIGKALKIAMEYGGTDGKHGKAWVIDQMVRALCGSTGGEDSEEYRAFIDEHNNVDGEIFEWDEGVSPGPGAAW